MIGSNSLIEDVEKDIETEHLKSNIQVENDLISYNVVFAKQKLNITVEHVLSMILEYAYYLCEKTHVVGFDDRVRVGKKCSDNNDVLITVWLIIFNYIDTQLLYKCSDQGYPDGIRCKEL